MTARKASWAEALVVGVFVFGVIGTGSFLALLAAFVAYIRTDESLWSSMGFRLPLCAAAASSVVGTLAWRFVVDPGASARRQGAFAGLTVGIAAHPLCWVFYSSIAADLDQFAGVSIVGFVFFATTLATFSSLLGLGWMSVPLCAVLGFFTADARSAVYRKLASPRERVPRLDDR